GPVCLEDVAFRFTHKDWALLDPDQRALQKEVKEENCGILDTLDPAACCGFLTAQEGLKRRILQS
ncbi:finger 850-like, partial [Podarcis lilfordi]